MGMLGDLVKGAKKATYNAGDWIDKTVISGDSEAKRKAAEQKAVINKSVDSNVEDSLKNQKSIQDKYTPVRDQKFDELDAVDDNYVNETKSLKTEAESSGKNASTVYDNMSGKYAGMTDTAEKEASTAMPLKEYMNPNNAVATATRDLYNTEGINQQKLYETQAQGEDKQGQASYGVLAALGAQATGAQMGGMGPLSVGQQVAMQAQNQRQAGEAYSNVQRRMQGLRDQGLNANVSNRDKGMAMGFERTDKAYEAGQGAKNRVEGLIRDRRGLEGEYRNFELANRGERSGYAGNIRATTAGKTFRRLGGADEDRTVSMQQESARIAEQMRKAGVSETAINAKLASDAANLAGRQAFVAPLAKAGATAAAAHFGGPAAGAAAGTGTDALMKGAAPGQPVPNAPTAASTVQQPVTAPTQSLYQGQTQSPNPEPYEFGSFLKKKYGNKPASVMG